MNQFGLGLIINAVDNASNVFDNITGSYNNMAGAFDSAVNSSVGANMSMLGDQIAAVGSQFTSFFSNIIGNVRTVGSEFEGFKLTLQSLYQETSENNPLTQKAIKDLFDFSIVSPFEVSDTKDLLVTLKSQGVDAFEELTDASGNTQKAMMWLTDLMAFKPDIDVSRWKLALTNFLGSGQGKVLENILDAGKIKQIIGHDIADTAEGRMKDLLEVIDKLGVRGLTESMSGTLETKLSNIQDFLTKFFYEISNSGAFDQIKRLVDNVSSAIIDNSVMTQENIENLAKGISDALHIFLDPLERATEVFKKYSTQWVQYLAQRPRILSTAFAITTMTGVMLIALGVFVKFGGVLTSFLASVKYLSGGKTLITLFTQSLWGIVRVIGPLAAGGYLLYKVWTTNIDNIQEKTKKLWDFLKNFAILIADALPDNILSKENYDLAKQMGLLPLIETVLNLKYYLGKFWEGFKKGFESILPKMVDVFYKIIGFAKILKPIFEGIFNFIKNITSAGLEQEWTNAGEKAGELAGWVLLILAILPKIEKFVRRIIAVVNTLKKLKTAIQVFFASTTWSRIYSVIRTFILDIRSIMSAIYTSVLVPIWTWLTGTAFPAIAGWFTSLAASLGVSVGVLGAIIAAVVALIVVVFIFRDKIAAFLVETWWKMKEFFTGLWEEIKQNPVAKFIGSLVYMVAGFIYSVFWGLVNAIVNLFKGIGNVFVFLGNKMKDIIDRSNDYLSYLWSDVLVPIGQSIVGAIDWIADKLSDGMIWLTDTLSPLGDFLYSLLTDPIEKAWNNIIKPIFDGIADFIDSFLLGWSDILNSVSGFFNNVGDFFFEFGNYTKEKTLGLATGGYVKTEGIAMLHPNEVVVNDELTKGLGVFLSDYDKAHRTSTPLIKQDIISTDDYAERDTDNPLIPAIDISESDRDKPDNSPSPMQAITNSYYTTNNENSSDNRVTNNSSSRTNNNSTSYDSNSDNSVVFQSGSIVMNINGADFDLENISDSDLNSVAERLMTIISRKMQLRNMQTRK